jgi:NTP pyrophosphatase (non-canonical NTP hydrolase)
LKVLSELGEAVKASKDKGDLKVETAKLFGQLSLLVDAEETGGTQSSSKKQKS